MFILDDDTYLTQIPKTSHARYTQRLHHFIADKRKYPRIRHHILWILHNCLVHFLLAFFPNNFICELHVLTSKWLNHAFIDKVPIYNGKGLKYEFRQIFYYQLPVISSNNWWIFHNAVSHMLIGLFPIGIMFRLHDWSAKKMNIQGWV